MDFKTLLEPYAEPDPEGRPRRTVEAQIKWLNRKGLPRNIIDQAILKVYNELERGMIFNDDEESTGGHKLDQHLLKTAHELQQAELSKQAKELEVFLTTFKQSAVEEYANRHRASIWQRIIAVFKPL